MLVERIGLQGQPVLQQRFASAGATCLVGRDLDCDIVLHDDHAAPRHAALTLLQDGRVEVRDLGTRNGTRVDGKRIPAEVGVVIEHGEVVVGRTRLYVRTRHTPIGQERVFTRAIVRRYRTVLGTAGLFASAAFVVFREWLDAPPATLLREGTAAGLSMFAAFAMWTGIWAAVAKLNGGRWDVAVHLAIASITVAFCAWGHWLTGVAVYAMQWQALTHVAFALIGLACMAALYMHLREATNCRPRTAMLSAAGGLLVALLVGWSSSMGSTDADRHDVNHVDLGPDVRLGAARRVPSRTLVDYFAEVEALEREAGRERLRATRAESRAAVEQ